MFYIDDLKLFSRNDGELVGLSTTIKELSIQIGINFGIDKDTKADIRQRT